MSRASMRCRQKRDDGKLDLVMGTERTDVYLDTEAPCGWCIRVDDPTHTPTPLTYQELLHPREGDQVTQDNEHQRILDTVVDILRRHLEKQTGVGVFSDLLLHWSDRDDLRDAGPDVAIALGLDMPPAKVGGRLVLEPSTGPRVDLVIEVISPTYAKQRRKDEEDNFQLYERAGIAEYLLIDPLRRGTKQALKLCMFRLESGAELYREVPASEDGSVVARSIGLRFIPELDAELGGRHLGIVVEATGKRLLSSREEAKARQQEAKARREAERRATLAEKELAKLREELARARRARSPGSS